jgi:polyhydroxyalkanoate synthesis repressor PhaR
LTPSLAEHDPVDPPREDATADHGMNVNINAFSDRAPDSSIAGPPAGNHADDPHDDGDANPASADAAYADAPYADTSYAQAEGVSLEGGEARRTIKRYSNRKLYDTRQSRYVTLLQIAEMVRAGEDVQIIDNATKEDKTDVTLALIISEELKARPRAIPLATLKALIRHRGGKLLTQLRESPIGRLMPRDEAGNEHEEVGPELAEGLTNHSAAGHLPANNANAEESHVSKEQPGGLRRTLEQWQHTIDDRIRAVVPHFSTIQELQGEVQQLSKRLEELEKRLANPRE